MKRQVHAAFLAVTLVLYGCGGQRKPPGLKVSIPYDADIWSDSQVTDQTSVPDMSTSVKRPIENITLDLVANGERSDIIEFYNRSYSEWKELTDWGTEEVSISVKGSVWKGWQREDTYAIIAVAKTANEKTVVRHAFGSRRHYDTITEGTANMPGMEPWPEPSISCFQMNRAFPNADRIAPELTRRGCPWNGKWFGPKVPDQWFLKLGANIPVKTAQTIVSVCRELGPADLAVQITQDDKVFGNRTRIYIGPLGKPIPHLTLRGAQLDRLLSPTLTQQQYRNLVPTKTDRK